MIVSFPPCDWDMAELPSEIHSALVSKTIEPRQAVNPEIDKSISIDEARRYLKDKPIVGPDEPGDDYPVIARLKDLGISPEKCADLLIEHGSDDSQWLRDTIDHAFMYGQNEPGSDVPRSAQEKFGPHVPPAPGVRIVQGTGDRPEQVTWLWHEWLPRGMFTLLGGEKGVGKSTLVYHILATITRGANWPDGSKAPQGDVLVWSAEDDWRVTILPRLMVAGADREHVYRVDGVYEGDNKRRNFDPATDMAGLIDAAKAIPNLAAVLIDPVVSAISGDSHKNAETRRGLQPLVDFAEARGAALIGITHFSKNTQGKSPLDRINGSLAFGAVARMVWGAVKSEDESAPRRFVRIASNLGPMGGGYDYTLNQIPVPGESFTGQGVAWGSYSQGSAAALIEEVQPKQGKSREELKFAEEFLLNVLANGAEPRQRDVIEAAKAHDISEITLKRARKRVGVIPFQEQGKSPPVYRYKLPPRVEPAVTEY